MIPRYLKIKLVATAALFLSLVAFGNITAYDVNFAFVQGVMTMETIGKDPSMTWRAIGSNALHNVFYWVIIAWQIVAAAACWLGVWRLYRARKSGVIGFQRAKSAAIFGLGAGLLLYFLAFITIGGEWFAMWRSQIWNGQSASHMIVTAFGIVLIYLSMRDEDVRVE